MRPLDPETNTLLGLETQRQRPRAYTVWCHSEEPQRDQAYMNGRLWGAQEMVPFAEEAGQGLTARFAGVEGCATHYVIWVGDEFPWRVEPFSPAVRVWSIDTLSIRVLGHPERNVW